MSDVNVFEFGAGDAVRIVTEDGEEFVGEFVGDDRSPADEYSKGYVDLTLEGVAWEDVRDRVDQSVLHVKQRSARRTGRPQDAIVYGYAERDSIADPYETVDLGTVETIERRNTE